MNPSLHEMLAALGDGEFTVRPFDNRFEAVVTLYPDPNEPDDLQRVFRAVGSSALTALTAAMLKSVQ
jgi:hypothetical protein